MSTNQEKLNEQLYNVIANSKDNDEGKLKKVKYLVRLGADVNANDGWHGETALMEAAHSGQLDVVEYLVQSGADVHQKDTAEWSALTYAAYSGQIEVVKYLAENGANVNARNKYGETALMKAAENGQIDVVKYLVEQGADVHQKDGWQGRTALMVAALNGHFEVVKCLVEHGADVHQKNEEGKTALDIARMWGKADCVEFLEEAQQKGEAKVEVLSGEEKNIKVKKRGMWQRIFGGRD